MTIAELGKVPELLAPAGDREAFFAAIHAGADAVYMGLKDFNARARAKNFTLDDLRELLPYARERNVRVLITLNILIKDNELEALIDLLAELEQIAPDALIVQDVTLIKLVREHFPTLRLHASTQMAVHNLAGAKQLQEWGIKRVVLARELTAVEIRRIRGQVAIELEAFCHGSLCYAYSGLCFFSGANDGRQWNFSDIDIAADFTMYSLNHLATDFWAQAGLSTLCLSIEDDRENMMRTLQQWSAPARPVVIIYKDTPLFIAESCSLTALHNGCPGSEVCGYRSLEIENRAGERFIVAHESCRSIVYGKSAYAIPQAVDDLKAYGVRDFRLDFLTRPYAPEAVVSIFAACRSSSAGIGALPQTHTANYCGQLI